MISDEEIIRIAREVGINARVDTLCSYPDLIGPLKGFAARVVANIDPSSFMSWQEGLEAGMFKEREACAKLCENSPEPDGRDLAERIRARGEA